MQQPPLPPQSSGSDLGGLRKRSLEGGSRGLGSAGTKNDAERDRGMDCSARGRGRSVRRFGSSRPIRAARDRRARSPHGHRRQAWRLPRDVDDDNHAGLRAHGSGFRQRDQVPVGVDRHEIPYASGRSRRSVPSVSTTHRRSPGPPICGPDGCAAVDALVKASCITSSASPRSLMIKQRAPYSPACSAWTRSSKSIRVGWAPSFSRAGSNRWAFAFLSDLSVWRRPS
jgi:hypothetical protein